MNSELKLNNSIYLNVLSIISLKTHQLLETVGETEPDLWYTY